MKCFRSGLVALVLIQLNACVPASKQGVKNQSPSVTFSGSFASSGGTTKIFFGGEELPLTETADTAKFTVDVPRDLIKTSDDRRLYFYNTLGEAAATAEILAFDIGEKVLPAITLTPEITVTGLILSGETPIPDASVKVGRAKTTSGPDGSYTLKLPAGAPLPTQVQKSGFVLTTAVWPISIPETRDFHLYNRLEPTGHIRIPTSNRLKVTGLPISIEATQSATYIRFSTSPITTPALSDASWQKVSDPQTITTELASAPKIYYQFADKDKKVLDAVRTLNTATNTDEKL